MPDTTALPARTIVVTGPGACGTFPPFTPGESDPLAFDVAAILNAGETVVSVTSVTLKAVADTTPTTRLIGAAVVAGTVISQDVGNWQDLRYINYLVTATFLTSQGATRSVQGYVAVQRQRAGSH